MANIPDREGTPGRATFSLHAIASTRDDDGFIVNDSSHQAPSTQTVMRAALASTYSPFAFATSTDARNSSAAFFVPNPRLSVCE